LPPNRRLLEQIAEKSKADPIVQSNFYTYLRQLMAFAFEPVRSNVSSAEVRTLLSDESFVSVVWQAAVTKTLALRTIGTLLVNRARIRELGTRPSAMPIPKSWEAYRIAFRDGPNIVSELDVR